MLFKILRKKKKVVFKRRFVFFTPFFIGFRKKHVLRLANVIFRRTRTNLFITLTDLHNKVVICFSSGSSNVGSSKKKKVSPYAVQPIVSNLINYLRVYRIRNVILVLSTYSRSHVALLTRELFRYGIRVRFIVNRVIRPHNGVKKPKKARK
jgi:ribosomal protein S11